MARREKSLSASRRLERSLPKLSPLMREAFASLWTDAQCDAWGRRAKAAEALKQAHEWLVVAERALKQSDDVPYSRQRLAWVASVAVLVENELSGHVSDALSEARRVRDEALAAAQQLRARTVSRATLLVGGNEERRVALSIASGGSVAETLRALARLLDGWRREARLRLLADELGLDEVSLQQLEDAVVHLEETELSVGNLRPRDDAPTLARLEGRLLRELHALQAAFDVARAEKLAVPQLKVRPALKALFAE